MPKARLFLKTSLMNSRFFFRILQAMAAAILLCGAAGLSRAEVMVARDANNPYQKNPHAKLKHVLLYDKAPGHGTGRAMLRASMARLAVKYGFRLDTSAAAIGYIQDSVVAGVDVVIFSNGDADVLGPMNSPSTVAMEKYIYQQGKAMLMVHAAGAFLSCYVGPYSEGFVWGASEPPPSECRFLARALTRQYYQHAPVGTPARIYVDSMVIGQMYPRGPLGTLPAATQYNHGVGEVETRAIFTGLPRAVDGLQDEWWSFYSSPRRYKDTLVLVENLGASYVEGRVNVLLSLDEAASNWTGRVMNDHPISWTRKMGKGLAAFNASGHDSVYVRNDSVMEKYNWRLLRYLARDFVGCTNPAFLEYNPEASVTTLTASDDPSPCKTVVTTSLRSGGSAPRAGISTRGTKIHITLAEPGEHVLRVLEVSGKQALARNVRGQGAPVQISGLKPGIYFVRVTAPSGAKTAARVRLF
jgi:hypothetical protein